MFVTKSVITLYAHPDSHFQSSSHHKKAASLRWKLKGSMSFDFRQHPIPKLELDRQQFHSRELGPFQLSRMMLQCLLTPRAEASSFVSSLPESSQTVLWRRDGFYKVALANPALSRILVLDPLAAQLFEKVAEAITHSVVSGLSDLRSGVVGHRAR